MRFIFVLVLLAVFVNPAPARGGPPTDVDGDGVGDLAIPVPFDAGTASVPVVEVASGFDGTVLIQIPGTGQGDAFGHDATVVPDTDGDGAADIAVTQPRAGLSTERAGAVAVYSGADGGLLWSIEARDGERIGLAVHAVDDQSEDGFPDLLVQGAYGSDGIWLEAIFLYSGASGDFLHASLGDYESTLSRVLQGERFYVPTDLNTDGVVDIIDVSLVLSASLLAPTSEYDLNNDGIVDQADVVVVTQDFVDGVATTGATGSLYLPADSEVPLSFETLWSGVYDDGVSAGDIEPSPFADPVAEAPPAAAEAPLIVVGPTPHPTVSCSGAGQTCDVQITVCGQDRTFEVDEPVTLKAVGSPPGGAYQWSIQQIGSGVEYDFDLSTLRESTFTFWPREASAYIANVIYVAPDGCIGCDTCIVTSDGACRISIDAPCGTPLPANVEVDVHVRGYPRGGDFDVTLSGGANLVESSPGHFTVQPAMSGEVTVEVTYTECPGTVRECVLYFVDPTVDTDNDGYSDYCEALWGSSEADPTRSPDPAVDNDRDGLSDVRELCEFGSRIDRFDSDGDGAGDLFEAEVAGVMNAYDATDGVPLGLQAIYRDHDRDRDQIYDEFELERGWRTDDPDMDRDGVVDGIEVRTGHSPVDPTSYPTLTDSDRDGLADLEELYLYFTDPDAVDSDQDRMPDGWEVANGLDPRKDDGQEDPDGDGLVNSQEFEYGTRPHDDDTDDDTVNDGDEVSHGGVPTDPCDNGQPADPRLFASVHMLAYPSYLIGVANPGFPTHEDAEVIPVWQLRVGDHTLFSRNWPWASRQEEASATVLVRRGEWIPVSMAYSGTALHHALYSTCDGEIEQITGPLYEGVGRVDAGDAAWSGDEFLIEALQNGWQLSGTVLCPTPGPDDIVCFQDLYGCGDPVAGLVAAIRFPSPRIRLVDDHPFPSEIEDIEISVGCVGRAIGEALNLELEPDDLFDYEITTPSVAMIRSDDGTLSESLSLPPSAPVDVIGLSGGLARLTVSLHGSCVVLGEIWIRVYDEGRVELLPDPDTHVQDDDLMVLPSDVEKLYLNITDCGQDYTVEIDDPTVASLFGSPGVIGRGTEFIRVMGHEDGTTTLRVIPVGSSDPVAEIDVVVGGRIIGQMDSPMSFKLPTTAAAPSGGGPRGPSGAYPGFGQLIDGGRDPDPAQLIQAMEDSTDEWTTTLRIIVQDARGNVKPSKSVVCFPAAGMFDVNGASDPVVLTTGPSGAVAFELSSNVDAVIAEIEALFGPTFIEDDVIHTVGSLSEQAIVLVGHLADEAIADGAADYSGLASYLVDQYEIEDVDEIVLDIEAFVSHGFMGTYHRVIFEVDRLPGQEATLAMSAIQLPIVRHYSMLALHDYLGGDPTPGNPLAPWTVKGQVVELADPSGPVAVDDIDNVPTRLVQLGDVPPIIKQINEWGYTQDPALPAGNFETLLRAEKIQRSLDEFEVWSAEQYGVEHPSEMPSLETALAEWRDSRDPAAPGNAPNPNGSKPLMTIEAVIFEILIGLAPGGDLIHAGYLLGKWIFFDEELNEIDLALDFMGTALDLLPGGQFAGVGVSITKAIRKYLPEGVFEQLFRSFDSLHEFFEFMGSYIDQLPGGDSPDVIKQAAHKVKSFVDSSTHMVSSNLNVSQFTAQTHKMLAAVGRGGLGVKAKLGAAYILKHNRRDAIEEVLSNRQLFPDDVVDSGLKVIGRVEFPISEYSDEALRGIFKATEAAGQPHLRPRVGSIADEFAVHGVTEADNIADRFFAQMDTLHDIDGIEGLEKHIKNCYEQRRSYRQAFALVYEGEVAKRIADGAIDYHPAAPPLTAGRVTRVTEPNGLNKLDVQTETFAIQVKSTPDGNSVNTSHFNSGITADVNALRTQAWGRGKTPVYVFQKHPEPDVLNHLKGTRPDGTETVDFFAPVPGPDGGPGGRLFVEVEGRLQEIWPFD